MAIDWSKIRALDTSQNNAFEELVCQLARLETIPHKRPGSFVKVGNPDAGVEGYCRLENGKECGWQAKYFNKMGKSQWAQITQSIHTAIEKRPNLVKYYVCVPLDRADPRLPNKTHFMDQWNDKVIEWKAHATQTGIELDFEYWGSSELIDRLSKEENAGRRYFWFGEEELSSEWFDKKLNESIANLGQRYTPALNFELPIAKNFDAIAINQSYVAEARDHFDKLLRAFNSQETVLKDMSFAFSTLRNLKDQFYSFQNDPFKRLDTPLLLKIVAELESWLANAQKLIDEEYKDDEEKHRSIEYHLRRLQSATYTFTRFLEDKYVELANRPAMLLTGDMGAGKSHLLADVAEKRGKNGKHSLLILGQHLTEDTPPWKQILENILLLKCSKEEFLGALSARAEADGERLVVFLDAINEGRGKHFWPDHVAGFINDFKKYPWLALVLSVRTTYEAELVTTPIEKSASLIRIRHTGFTHMEYEAVKKFFGIYGINQLAVPLLNPEFRNPLFLKLFCEGLKRSGIDTISKGHDGISNIMQHYFSAVNRKLARPVEFDYSSTINLVEKSVLALIGKQLDSGIDYLNEEEAHKVVQDAISGHVVKTGFLQTLISEGVLTKNRFYVGEDKWEEGVYLTYERFSDYFKAKFLYEKYVDEANPQIAFQREGYIHTLLFSDKRSWGAQGIIESLSILLPEKLGMELYELVTEDLKSKPYIADAFVDSLLWRKPETITKKSDEYINTSVFPYKRLREKFLDVCISQAGNAEHLYNAKALHTHLMGHTLADRDAGWTIYITDKLDKESAINRLLDWVGRNDFSKEIASETVFLLGTAISWLQTATNRELRDIATKRLICLYDNRISEIVELLKQFDGINDPYVYERLYAVAYGCSLRASDLSGLKELALYIYEKIFNVEKVYPHILLRDYARGVIEYALFKGITLNIDVAKISPPYQSDFPDSFPTNEEIDEYEFDYQAKDFKDHYWGQNKIIRSMTTEHGRGIGGYGDFGRYTFQSSLSDWKDLDPQSLSNYAVKRIMEMGYDVNKHGAFDRYNSSRSRKAEKIERIGKKYQWIAMHEVLALVGDKYKMQNPAVWGEEDLIYMDGPWEPSVRDIDPSAVVGKIEATVDQSLHWSEAIQFNNWEGSLEDWLVKADDLPEPISLIETKDTENNSWLVLSTSPTWEEPLELGAKEYNNRQRKLWYNIHAYLVGIDDVKALTEYAWNQKYVSLLETPSSPERDLYKVFSREFYWSAAYKFFNTPYYYGEEWHKLSKDGKTIGKVMATTERYLKESGSDYSLGEGLQIKRPHRFLYEGMGMRFSRNDGELIDSKGRVVCFDPSFRHPTSSALLVRKDAIIPFLNANKLTLLWALTGEKSEAGASMMSYSRGIEPVGVYWLSEKGDILGKTQIRTADSE